VDHKNISALGRKAVQRKDWPTVNSCADRLIALNDSSVEGYFLKGLVAKAAGRPLRAIELLENALQLDPKRYDAAIELASQYIAVRRFSDAVALQQRYEEHLVNSPRYLDMAATNYITAALPDKAWPLYVKANELQPEIDLFRANMAACAVYLGKIDEARDLYEDLLQRFPGHQRNHYQLSRLTRATDHTHVQQMLKVLYESNLPPEKNIFLYYALGKLGGDAAKRTSGYRVEADVGLIREIISTYDSAWFSNTSPANIESSATPIFIVGLPRTGTTITEQILSEHSQVESVDETQFIELSIRRRSAMETSERMNEQIIQGASMANPEAVAQDYLSDVSYLLRGRHYFIDKLPYNFLYLGIIAKAFPEAPLIYLRRNPMDACFAMYKQVFTWAYKFSYDLNDLGRYYVAHRQLLDHWRSQLGGRLIEVSYESFIKDQERETRVLLEALGLPMEDACLQFQRNDSISMTASSVQIREGLHNRSVEKWKHFSEPLAPLRTIFKEAGINPDEF